MGITQKEELIKLREINVPTKVYNQKNKEKSWRYGYQRDYDFVVISRTGQIGDLVEIQGVKIALPPVPEEIYARHEDPKEQYWERVPVPDPIRKIKSSDQFDKQPNVFKLRWDAYIDREFDRREEGFWFMNNGEPTYITGSHYMYLQWSKIDVGYPEFRYANRVLFYFWEACKADSRSFGMCYVKNRRSGASFMASSECINIGSISTESMIGIVSKTGSDAKSMFVKKVVPININYPFFFKPIMSGVQKPKTEISYQVPSTRITRKNMTSHSEEEDEGLNTIITWTNTDDNAFDGEKLILLIEDEAGKHTKPNNILNGWQVAKTTLVLGSKIVGKAFMCSTVNALSKGGEEFKKIYEDSKSGERTKNNRTKSGLYGLFIPMEYNMEGFLDKYGWPVLHTPEEEVEGIDGEIIEQGAIDWWEGEVEARKSKPDILNEFYRQFPRTESHAFRDESKESLFNLTKIYDQIDFNDASLADLHTARGNFAWKNGVKDTVPEWRPNPKGRFLISGWIPSVERQGAYELRNGIKYPVNEHMGSFGCDPYDISGVVDGRGSKGSLHGLTKFHMDQGPVNEFFLEYISRPPTAEIFFEDVLLAILFYSMPILAENNKPRLLYHLKNRGYRGFSMNRPDKSWAKLSKTEKELGGMPNSSTDIKQAHAAAIESYIDKYIGYGDENNGRPEDECGTMLFNRTLTDWSKFDINNRTMHDASISSGLAIMANQRHMYTPKKVQTEINVNFARYDNSRIESALNRK